MGFSYLIRAAQFFEYKMGHSPDKCNESFFGFNSVLPGAYSLFRWEAIKGKPLDKFFKNINRSDNPSCSEANEFLAEDRVMCLQIYIKEHEKFYLTYIPEAKAITDAPDSLSMLIKQRRRWINGSLFGTIKVLTNFSNMISCKRTKHPCHRQFLMLVFMIYHICTFLLSFFALGSMYASVTLFLN
jgi:chitin synthase